MGSQRLPRVRSGGWPRAECQNLTRVREGEMGDGCIQGADQIYKYSEDNGGRVPHCWGREVYIEREVE